MEIAEGKMKKILEGEKSSLRIEGFAYDISLNEEGTVSLAPRNGGRVASSEVEADNYAYTHGGTAFREAIHAAWLIAEEWRSHLQSLEDAE